MKFTVFDDDKQIECRILFTFKDEANNVNYIVYKDGTLDEENQERIYASRYILENNNYILKPIENEYEWELIDNMIESKCKEAD